MALGLVLIAIGTFILHNVTIYTTYYALWFPLLLTGLGLGLVFPNSPSLGMQALPKEKLGEGAGIINTINYYSGILCVAIGTLISILLGREKFYQSIAPTELPSITLSQIDRAVFGHQGNLQQILSSLSDSTQNQLIHTNRKKLYSRHAHVLYNDNHWTYWDMFFCKVKDLKLVYKK